MAGSQHIDTKELDMTEQPTLPIPPIPTDITPTPVEPTASRRGNTATQRQLDFLKSLYTEIKDLAAKLDAAAGNTVKIDAVEAIVDATFRDPIRAGEFNDRKPSELIDAMIKIRDNFRAEVKSLVAAENIRAAREANPPAAELEDGIYRNPNTEKIFKVYHTVHGRNVQVAKELVLLDESEQYTKVVRGKDVLVKAEFIYRGMDAAKALSPRWKMDLEEAKKYGAIYGVCVRCAATLTAEVSIERAMGPVCAGKF